MQKGEFAALADIYKDELFGNILPFWMKNGIDKENGGFFTCFSNDGTVFLHKHKFAWSQGRFVWMLSRLYSEYKGKIPKDNVDRYLSAAKAGADFLMKNVRLPSGACAFIMSDKGAPILLDANGQVREKKENEFFDLSIYADTFVLYGISEYARVTGDKRAFAWAKELYKSIAARFDSGNYHSWPYPVPEGYKMHGLLMGYEPYQEFADTAKLFGDKALAEDLMRRSDACIQDTLGHFLQPDHLIREFIGNDNKPRKNILGEYINPGHTLEDIWFMMHNGLKTGRKGIFKQVVPIILKTLDVAWDSEFGGIPQFIHYKGGVPRGDIPSELAKEEMIAKLKDNWDNKLWWPHSEALYTLALAYEQTRDTKLWDWFQRMHEYTFRTFPNPDKAVGEWIQIRNRKGEPEDKIVALPVKDPFHVTRVFIHIINCLDRLSV